MCVNHYMQWIRKNGGKAAGVPPSASVTATDRWWAKVNRDGPISKLRPDLGCCWLWTASPDKRGYGWIKINDKQVGAHRFGYELLVGPIPDGLDLDHLCNVPICVNPMHLDPCTHAENNARKVARTTHCKRGHAFEPDNYYTVSNGRGLSRRCKTCRRALRAAKNSQAA